MSARTDGYLAIRDYAAIGDGRTVALVGADGSIDWLCLPDLDSASVFGALLDSERGGRFSLAPVEPFETARRYLPDTNVLETTFKTTSGVVRVADALTLPGEGLSPYRELVRRVDGLSGQVPMSWRVAPRFAYGAKPASFRSHGGIRVTADGPDALAVLSWDAGTVDIAEASVGAHFTTTDGGSGLIVLSAAHQEPLVYPQRTAVERRLQATGASWSAWAAGRNYDGPWRQAVVRSALALKLLVFAPSGAIAAAATTSLPEEIGGSRNWDYRYSWPRDAAFTLQALLALGCAQEAHAFFSWLLHASQLTQPRLQVLYRLNGRADARERELPLTGYRGSAPVRTGNGAAAQLQLDVYGEVMVAAALLADFDHGLDRDHARRLAEMADLLCSLWRQPDAGIWEVRADAAHFVESKMMCAVALDRAAALADAGYLPRASVGRWRAEGAAVRAFVEAEGYSEPRHSYIRAVGENELDASLLLAVLLGYDRPSAPRLRSTVEAIRRQLAEGPLLRRYQSDDGLEGGDGAFLACSFWLVEALARQGRTGEAIELMDELVELGNDVGLYSEELDGQGAFLGNFPQGLSHLALINAAVAITEAHT
ncbi:MAG TPA: glycoside hydrolase family 15 protein [Gaiellaceae bacterium]|nr:glycoside hydrolase family 15 protein [Gaiellaceae bacterium]